MGTRFMLLHISVKLEQNTIHGKVMAKKLFEWIDRQEYEDSNCQILLDYICKIPTCEYFCFVLFP